MKNSAASWARVVGNSFAHLQHSVDKVTEWGFKKMKEAAKTKKSAPKDENVAMKGARGVVGFLGEAGDAFYRKYEDLKRKEK